MGDVSESGASAGMEQFLRDHSTGALPEARYDHYARESLVRLRAALAEMATAA
jgi:D-psicose/D-tagatose/L-ribulose 3-epimerase